VTTDFGVELSAPRPQIQELIPSESAKPAIQTLETEGRAMYAGEIAAELDKSYQLVGRRGKTLEERGLVNRDVNDQERRTFEITPLAESSYFQEADRDSLNITADEETTGPESVNP
jgi:DNA-binding MarR family transcriptional regulator